MSYYDSGYPRDEDDHYPTFDHRLVDQLAHHFPLQSAIVWEPCPGEGDLARQLRAYGAQVLETRQDFYTIDKSPYGGARALITNPPYLSKGRDTGRFIAHALDLMPDAWVIILVRWAWLGSAGTKNGKRDLTTHPRFYALTMPDCRPMWIRGSKGGPMHAFTWLAWAPAHMIKPKHPIIWI
jgi:hypothetical protein